MTQERRLIYTAAHAPLRQFLAWSGIVGGFGLVGLMLWWGAQRGHWGAESLGVVVPAMLAGLAGVFSVLQRTEVRIDQDLVRVERSPFGGGFEITRRSVDVDVHVSESYDDETGTTTKHYSLYLRGAGREGEAIRLKLATGFGVPKLGTELRDAIAAVPPRLGPGGPPAMLEPRVEALATDAGRARRGDGTFTDSVDEPTEARGEPKLPKRWK